MKDKNRRGLSLNFPLECIVSTDASIFFDLSSVILQFVANFPEAVGNIVSYETNISILIKNDMKE